MTFLEKISSILDVPLRQGKIRQYAALLDREGRITKKVQLDLILAICEEIVEMQNTPTPAPITTMEISPIIVTRLSKEEELYQKRLENIKKAQAARKAKYEQRKQEQANTNI